MVARCLHFFGIQSSPVRHSYWSLAAVFSAFWPLGGAGVREYTCVLLLWEFVLLVSLFHPKMLSAGSDTPPRPRTPQRTLDSWKFQSSETNYPQWEALNIPLSWCCLEAFLSEIQSLVLPPFLVMTLCLRTHAQRPYCAFELDCQKAQRGFQMFFLPLLADETHGLR